MAYQLAYRCASLAAIVLLVSLCLGACQPAPLPERSVVNFVSSPGFGDLEGYVDQFEAAHPDIQINLTYRQHISREWPRRFDAALVGNTLNSFQTDLWLDLTPWIEPDSQFDGDDYFPRVLSAGYVEGRLLALPVSWSFDVLVYNPHLLTAAGAAQPTPDWRWTDLRNTAVTLGRYCSDGRGTVFASGGEQSHLIFGWLGEQAPLYESTDGRVAPSLDRPQVSSALLDACQVLSELPLAPDTSATAMECLARLQNGEAAMTVWYHAIKNLSSQYPDLAVTALPRPCKDLRVDAALAISRGTEHAQAAWQWIHFLSRQNLHDGSSSLPARQSVLENLGLWQTWDAEMVQVAQTVLTGDTEPALERYQEPLQIVYEKLWQALCQTCDEGVPAEAALKTAQKEAQDELAQWYAERQVEPAPFKVVAPAPAGETAKTLDFLALSGHEPFYQAAAEAFQTFHPEWSIQFSNMTPEATLEADCISFEVSPFDAPIFLSFQGRFLPLESVAELGPGLSEDGFFPSAIQPVSWQGQLLAVPIAVRPLVLYYDADLFLELGLSPPTSAWTVADVLDTAEKITAAAPHRLGYAPHPRGEVRFVLAQQGISLFDEGPRLAPRFTQPDVLAAIERLRALQGDQEVAFGEAPAMIFSIFSHKTPAEADWPAVALEPRPGTQWPVTLLLSGVNRDSANVQMAWEWIAFLAQWDGIHGDDLLPAVRVLATRDETHLELGDELYTAYLTALERDTARTDSEETLIKDVAVTWFDLALIEAESGDLESALEQAQARAKQFIDCQAGRVDLQALTTCVRQVDPDHWLARSGSEQ